MTNGIIVEREVANPGNRPEIVGGARGDVVSTIMADLYLWRRLRDGTFEHLWDEFYATQDQYRCLGDGQCRMVYVRRSTMEKEG